MPEQTKSFLKYPNIKTWENAAKACATVDELSVMAKELKIGMAGGTIHRFWMTNQMALAHWWLNKQMPRLNAYKMNDGTFREYSTPSTSPIK